MDKYVEKTHDEEAIRFKLIDFDGEGPDWAGFSEWVQSNPNLKLATNPLKENEEENENDE